MTLSVPYRDEPRTPLAFGLSVLLHGLVVAAMVALIWKHAPPEPPPPKVFTLFAAPSPEANPDDSSGGQQTAKLSVPDLQKLSPLPEPTPEVFPPTPPTPPAPPAHVAPTPAVATTAKPVIAQRGATAQKPQATVMDLKTWQALHPSVKSATPANSTATTLRRGTVPNVGINPDKIVNALNRGSAGTGRGRGASTSPANSAEETDYVAYLVSRLKHALTLPGGISGLSADVQMTIDADGTVVEKKIIRNSGNAGFDAAVKAALDSLTNVDPPPSRKEVTYQFRYQPDMG